MQESATSTTTTTVEPPPLVSAAQLPASDQLRARVTELRRLAESIEAVSAMSLAGDEHTIGWSGPRADLCDRMLARSVHQLHEAVEDLRESALSLSEHADRLDLEHRTCVA